MPVLKRALRVASARLTAAHLPNVRWMSGAGYTNDQVKQMRAITSAPMKECVKALKATEGKGIDEAIAWLRKAGVASAHKKADRTASDGAVVIAATDAGVACIEVNTETDFVARNEVFQELAAAVARSCLALASSAASGASVVVVDVATLGGAKLASGAKDAPTVSEALAVAMTQLGENIVLRRACLLPASAPSALVASYVHNTYSAGVGRAAAAVSLVSDAVDREALRKLGEQIAMHVVASAPLSLSRADVPAERLAKEREILTEQATTSGKPADVVEKMVAGRLNKFYQEVALLEQPFVLDEKGAPVQKALDAAAASLGAPVRCVGFIRYAVGQAE